MPLSHHLPPGYVIVYPNRDRPSSHIAKALVVAVLLLSVVVILAITLGGWSRLDGMTPISFLWCLIYVVIAFYIWRWARGLLPIAVTLATLLLIPAVVATAGFDGTTWSQRASAGYGSIDTIFGSGGLSPQTLALLTVLLILVQLALIGVSINAFRQGWNIEHELPEAELVSSHPRG
jgi:hypothetical protein